MWNSSISVNTVRGLTLLRSGLFSWHISFIIPQADCSLHPVLLFYPPSGFLWWTRRHTPYGNQTDYRIFELNKRLQNWTEVCRHLHSHTHTHTLSEQSKNCAHCLFSPSAPCRSAIICGGMHLLQNSLKMMPCWPLLSVLKMDPNATVRDKVSH